MFQNLRIERFWVEVNAQINYTIKNALRGVEERGAIDMELQDIKFYVSTVTLKVSRIGMQQSVAAWNYHPIPGDHPNNKSSIDGFLVLFLIVHRPDSDRSLGGFMGHLPF